MNGWATAPGRRHNGRVEKPWQEGSYRVVTPRTAWRSLRALAARGWQAIVVGLLILAVAIAAFLYPGNRQADLRLNHGSVFVTKRGAQLVGQLNKQIDELSSSSSLPDRDFEVYQESSTVLIRLQQSNLLQRYDPGTQQMGAPVILRPDAQVRLGGGVLAIVNTGSGRGWYGGVDQVLTLDVEKANAQFDVGQFGQVTVTTGGEVIALSVARGEIVRPATKKTTKLPFTLGAPADVEISAVGDKAVVLDRRSGQLWVEGERSAITLPGAAAAHLPPPAEHGLTIGGKDIDAVVATPAGLVGVSGMDLVSLARPNGQSNPIQPVVVGDCAYGEFGGTVAVACSHRAPRFDPVPTYTNSTDLAFRVNSGIVVLNASVDGKVWLVDEGMKLIEDWERVAPPRPKQQGDKESDKTERVNPDRSKPNRPPVAKDDPDLVVRAGRSTMLPVLDNDYDPDGDILTVARTSTPQTGALDLVRGGTGLQFTAPANAVGARASFTYTISDGRGGEATATVTVRIVSPDQRESNRAPLQLGREDPHVIAQFGTFRTRALLDWRDPEGDDMVLVAAHVEGDTGDEVSFTPDGVLTFTDVGTKQGRKVIKVQISDGPGTTEGEIIVDVRKDGQIPPLANGDYYQVPAGKELVAKPLDNDQGSNLLLSWVNTKVGGASVVPDFTGGTFRFRAETPGTYYVDYIVTSGPTSYGLVRIDVSAPSNTNSPPVAVRDVALLPAGGSVLVDPLLNDEDADGDVLVLQSVSADPLLRIEMSERHLLRITAISAPRDPVVLTYVVSDGLHSVAGTLVIIPAPTGANTHPVALNDAVSVRAGAIATTHVLLNDYSPVGSALSLDPTLVERPAAGTIWVDGETVRFAAPQAPGSYKAVYQVRDEQGQVSSAVIRYTVVAADAENRAPVPKDITGRVLSGTTTKIPISLEGLDPNGDAVRLLGLDSGPQLGRIVSVGDYWLEYEAYPSARGTDTFTYAVTDSFGLKGIGTIRVGVAPAGELNNPPTAVDDRITTRPGREIRVPLLANDYDQDGDRFGFVDDGFRFPAGITVRRINDAEVAITIPPGASGIVQGTYTIQDTRGGRASANVIITIDPQAPLQPPLARDDTVSADRVVGQTEIDVPVLVNDADPDGNLDRATLSIPKYDCVPDRCAVVPGANATATADHKVIRVTIGPVMQQIRYAVTDTDGLTSYAVLTVPGFADSVPALNPRARTPEVVAGEPLELDITQYVLGTQGRKVMLTSDGRIWASNGRGQATNPRAVRFVSDSSYQGPASIVFEVTDGKNVNDADGRRAVISIPITVKPRPDQSQSGGGRQGINRPPLAPAVSLQVGAGENQRIHDLRTSASDPDGDVLRFTQPAGDIPLGLRVQWDGTSVITASAELTTRPGTRATLRGEVSDGRGGVTPLQIEIVVVASSAPRASLQDDNVPAANQGKTVDVSPLANDTSPWPDKPLTLVGAVVESGVATVSNDGSRVSITPGADFVGVVVVRYTVADATKAPERYVDARIRVTVRGRPGAPGVVRPSDNTDIDGKLTVTWTAPNDNGAPVTGYALVASGGGRSVTTQCPATTCTITGLTNGVHYTLQVTATNEVGTGPASQPSGELTPDVKPDPPMPPQTVFGDREITVNWVAPNNRGSAIVRYEVQATGDINDLQTNLTATTATFKGLTNGVAYRFRVRAINTSTMASEWSQYSLPETPAGPPGPPAGAVTARDVGEQSGAKVEVTWGPSDPNGDDPSAYVIDFLDPAGVLRGSVSVPKGQWDATDPARLRASVVVPNGEYRFAVHAVNKAGPGRATTMAGTAVIYGAPAAPGAPQLRAGDGSLGLQVATVPANGAPVSYEVTIDGSAAQRSFGQSLPARVGTSATITQLAFGAGTEPVSNGVAYGAGVRACSQVGGGVAKCSAWGPRSATVVPSGVPGQPGVRFEGVPDRTANPNATTSAIQVIMDNPGGNTYQPPGTSGPWSNGHPIRLVYNNVWYVAPTVLPPRTGRVEAWAAATDGGPSSPRVTTDLAALVSVAKTGARTIAISLNYAPPGGARSCTVVARNGSAVAGGYANGTFTADADVGPGAYSARCEMAIGGYFQTPFQV